MVRSAPLQSPARRTYAQRLLPVSQPRLAVSASARTHAQRVAQRNCAAVGIDARAGLVDAQLAQHRQPLSRGFVQLDDMQIGNRQPIRASSLRVTGTGRCSHPWCDAAAAPTTRASGFRPCSVAKAPETTSSAARR